MKGLKVLARYLHYILATWGNYRFTCAILHKNYLFEGGRKLENYFEVSESVQI